MLYQFLIINIFIKYQIIKYIQFINNNDIMKKNHAHINVVLIFNYMIFVS